MAVTGGVAAMTVPRCLEACHVANDAFGGVEYAQQCYYGSSMPPTPATDEGVAWFVMGITIIVVVGMD
jgi:hypothetical protein